MQRDRGAIALIILVFAIIEIYKGYLWVQAHPLLFWGSLVGIVSLLMIGYILYRSRQKNRQIEESERYRHWQIEKERQQQERARIEVEKSSRWSQIAQMSSRQFEKFVADIYKAKGYDVELTPATGDGGKDVILRENGNVMYYVECKHWTKNNVGEPQVRSLLGAMAKDGVDKGIFITTSDFTSSAHRAAGSKITLINKDALLSLVTVVMNQ